jgi:hypothetical protein
MRILCGFHAFCKDPDFCVLVHVFICVDFYLFISFFVQFGIFVCPLCTYVCVVTIMNRFS